MRRPWLKIPPKLVLRDPCHNRRRSLFLIFPYLEELNRSFSPSRSMRKILTTYIQSVLCHREERGQTHVVTEMMSRGARLVKVILQLDEFGRRVVHYYALV